MLYLFVGCCHYWCWLWWRGRGYLLFLVNAKISVSLKNATNINYLQEDHPQLWSYPLRVKRQLWSSQDEMYSDDDFNLDKNLSKSNWKDKENNEENLLITTFFRILKIGKMIATNRITWMIAATWLGASTLAIHFRPQFLPYLLPNAMLPQSQSSGDTLLNRLNLLQHIASNDPDDNDNLVVDRRYRIRRIVSVGVSIVVIFVLFSIVIFMYTRKVIRKERTPRSKKGNKPKKKKKKKKRQKKDKQKCYTTKM